MRGVCTHRHPVTIVRYKQAKTELSLVELGQLVSQNHVALNAFVGDYS